MKEQVKNCIVCQKEFKKPINASRKRWSEAYKTCSNICKNVFWIGKPSRHQGKNKAPAWNKGIPNPNIRGEKNNFWKGGITPIHQQIRTSAEYRDWRIKVLKRDNYTCVLCGNNGITLQVDHIKPFAYFPELRLVIDNGRTLCVPCHKNTETYAGKVFKYQESI